jgi:hypothetical protein
MKSLIAKISTPVKISIPSKNIFEEPTIVELDHMLAIARPYRLGADSVDFEIVFGKVDNEVFKKNKNTQLTLLGEELSSWGENDEACYNIIASKLGTEIISFENLEINAF